MAGVASAQATIAGAQYVKGKRDQKKAEANRPVYNIDEYKQNLNQAQQEALQGTPESIKQQEIYNSQQRVAQAMAQTSQRKGGLTGIAALNQNQIQGQQNVMAMDAQAKQQNLQNLKMARGQYADYLGQKFQINQSNPFYERNKQSQARTGALFQNLSNAGNTVAGANFGGQGGQKNMPVVQQQSFDQFGTQGYGQNQYNYNYQNNQGGIVPDGQNYQNLGQGYV